MSSYEAEAVYEVCETTAPESTSSCGRRVCYRPSDLLALKKVAFLVFFVAAVTRCEFRGVSAAPADALFEHERERERERELY